MPAVKIQPRKHLRYYQAAGVRFSLEVPHPALWWKMRLGKTLTCIRSCLLYRDCMMFLVVAPFSALAAWEEELHAEGQHVVLLYGERQKRLSLLQNTLPGTRTWFLLNKEGHFVIPEIAGMPWDVVILDESIFIANPGAQTTQYYIKHFRTAKHRWALCGTPAPESPLQYFCQLKWLDVAAIPEKNYYEFRHHHFQLAPNGYDWRITEDGSKYLTYHLNKCSLFLNRADVRLGGLKIREQKMVQMPKELAKAYRKLESDFYFELLGAEHDTIFASQRYLWMRRMCGGFHQEIGLKSYHKCDELLTILRGELVGEQVVIWCQFIEEVLGVCEYLNQHGIEADFIYGDVSPEKREEKRRRFQKGVLPALVILTSTMCFSAKLTAAGALIYYSSPESGKIREQSEDRHIDLQVSDSALLIDMPCMDTVEEDILEAHIQKESASGMIERMAKSIQRRIR